MQKRKIDIQQIPHDERRDAYRRPQTQAHQLSIAVTTPPGEVHSGQFHDLSISGASARFAIHAAVLAVGDVVTLTIGSLTRPTRVITKARVMFCGDAPGGRHCGFQFIEPKLLLPQIDSFYARFFNRRRSQRVGMPLDKKIAVHFFLTGEEVKGELVDLSLEGMQARLSRERAKVFDGQNHAFFRFTLPGQQEELTGRGAILRRTQARDVVTLGLAFDLVQETGISKRRAALESWILHRSNEISKWDGALRKPDAA